MKDKVNFNLLLEELYLMILNDSKLDENKTKGEVNEIHREIYAVEYSINNLKKLKK